MKSGYCMIIQKDEDREFALMRHQQAQTFTRKSILLHMWDFRGVIYFEMVKSDEIDEIHIVSRHK